MFLSTTDTGRVLAANIDCRGGHRDVVGEGSLSSSHTVVDFQEILDVGLDLMELI